MVNNSFDEQVRYIEKKMIYYNEIDAYIRGLELDRKILLENNTYGITSINYESLKLSRTNSITCNFTKFIERVEELDNKIIYEKQIKSKIDEGIDNLIPLRKDIIMRGYIENVEWSIIAYENNMTETSLRRSRRKALESITRVVYGHD